VRFGYTRVSTAEQSHDLQVDAIRKQNVESGNIYSDTLTGASIVARRPGFEAMRTKLQAGDELIVWRLDRLGRSMVDCVTTMDVLHKAGIRIRTIEDNLDSGSDFGRAMLGIMASLAELERETIRRRVNAGIAAAKARGVHCGRRPVATIETARVIREYQSQGIRTPEIARMLKMSRASVYNALKLLKVDTDL
jgi:DNA invertase Pin-like site-specific DNA recombinase